MNLNQWAVKWGVPLEALEEFTQISGIDYTPPRGPLQGEARVQSLVRLEASRVGVTLWRNNNGACYDKTGRLIRYGLANDNAETNDKFKSSDLIGMRPVLIQPCHVGSIFGQFVAREIKPSDWNYSGTKREQAQKAFIDFVNKKGGDAKFATSEGTL